MSQFIYFQKYHGKENVHSSNVLYMLQRIYYYNPRKFYNFLKELLDSECPESWLLQFKPQEKYSKGVTDFSIIQKSFKIVVEAKEKNNHFDSSQIERHMDALKSDFIENKIFLALAPFESGQDIFADLKQKHKEITFLALTYKQLYEKLLSVIDEGRDFELKDMVDEFYEYCNVEDLIDETDNTIMVRLAGDTMDFNIQEENRIYYDKAVGRFSGFRYIGLYKNKSVKYVGKVIMIVEASRSNQKIQCELKYPENGKIDEKILKRIENAMRNQDSLYDNTNIPHYYYLVDQFCPVENFTKKSNRALYGKKKFFLKDLGLSPNAKVEEIAEKMKNKHWEDLPL
ncbi:MAG TPA: hypothetical protein DDW54_03650 [Clostridiales bacterium]|nr:hypothetical protein [Clostridiales bacterium]